MIIQKFDWKMKLGISLVILGFIIFLGIKAQKNQSTFETMSSQIIEWIWVNTSDTICENFFEIPAGEYLIVSTSGQTKTVWPLIEAMKLKPCGNLAKKM